MADTADRSAFIAALFEIAKERRRETIITPWDGKLALISAHTPDYVHASLDMGVFDIPVDEAKELIKLANSRSISPAQWRADHFRNVTPIRPFFSTGWP